MYIGYLSKQTGASRKAIYLYEEMGLIPTPLRKGKYRVYAPEVVEIVKTIKCAQSLGFKLKELAEILQSTSARQWPNLEGIAEQLDWKRRALQEQIDSATTQIRLLDELRQRLAESPSVWECEKSR
ncbi:MerR family transcriptional regulator [Zobellella iuensis]|uniref:MerR family transcriptional regulator n=1 Tax=Zobellella iuensis TaxID=2803811 RepID=A0ABS1QQ02_9GAMM|nr:MerR family transcriptional regulator [Zobellella iuensis]MBL1376945.1 MerR family transcriptional regulator [Zobellella iuensis]